MKIFLIIAALTGAFLLGRSSQRPDSVAPTATEVPKEKLQAILDADYQDYQRLKTLEEKYKKADEILGKMMVVFLSDLQLHVTRPADAVEAKPQQSTPVINPTPRATPTPVPVSTPARAPMTPSRSDNHETGAERQIQRRIDSRRKENLQPAWASAKPVTRFPPNLEGCFIGTLTKDETHEVLELSLYHHMNNAREGMSTIVTRARGGAVSRTTGRGNPNGYRTNHSDFNALLIETSDWTYELYFAPDMNGWIGNVYHKLADESRKPEGRVVVMRGSGCEGM